MLQGRKLVGCAVGNARAHLWSMLFSAIGAENVDAATTNARATHDGVYTGRTTFWEKKSSEHADRFAKPGAKLHPWEVHAIAIHSACRQIVKEAAI